RRRLGRGGLRGPRPGHAAYAAPGAALPSGSRTPLALPAPPLSGRSAPPHHRRLLDRAVRGRVLGPVHREDVTMPARGNALKRTVRSLGGKVLRRFRLLPGGMPDGLGDDAALAEASLEGDVVLYFPDTMDSLYQLRSWYGPLLELHRAQGVTIVCMDSRTAAAIRAEVNLPVVTIALDATLDALILRSDTKLVLYVNYTPLNTAALRSRSAIHVSLLHGDSDKVVSVSNQIKAYDYSFVAGQAAIDRLARYTTLFDAPARCIPVGRPSLDTDRTE